MSKRADPFHVAMQKAADEQIRSTNTHLPEDRIFIVQWQKHWGDLTNEQKVFQFNYWCRDYYNGYGNWEDYHAEEMLRRFYPAMERLGLLDQVPDYREFLFKERS